MSTETDTTVTPANEPQADAATNLPDVAPGDLAPDEAAASVGADPVDLDAAALDAFDAGVAEHTAADAVDADAPKDAADVAAAAKEGAAKDAPAATKEGEPAQPDPDVDQAVKDLGLKGKAEARFREMSSTIKEISPLRDVLAKYELTDPAQIEQAIESARRNDEWERTVLASTATPEQFGTALNAIRALNSGDPAQMQNAFQEMLGAVQVLGQKLGREVPGLFDPLDSHPDLRQAAEAGQITRQLALEVAQQRASALNHQQLSARQTTEIQQQQAIQQAATDIGALNEQLKGADPDFARKIPFLQPALETIRSTLPPQQWAEAVKRAYLALPALPPAAAAPVVAAAPAARPPVGHMPLRPTGAAAAMRQRPRNDEEAFDMGVQSVSG